jgi:thiamine monophosphate synthase
MSEEQKSAPECGLYIVLPDRAGAEEADKLAFQLRQALHAANVFSKYGLNRHIVEYRPQEGDSTAAQAARLYRDVCTAGGFIFLIRDDFDLAQESEADGVVCSSLKKASEARKVLGEDKIIGLACAHQSGAQSALALDLDFVLFHTAPGGEDLLGLLHWWAATTDKPSALEGTFDQENCEMFVKAGATFIEAGHHIWTHPSGNVMQGVVNMLDAFERYKPSPKLTVIN